MAKVMSLSLLMNHPCFLFDLTAEVSIGEVVSKGTIVPLLAVKS
jgi:hypothetical protein